MTMKFQVQTNRLRAAHSQEWKAAHPVAELLLGEEKVGDFLTILSAKREATREE